MTKNNYGTFEITVPAVNGQPAIPHDSKIKVSDSGLDLKPNNLHV
jgi:1,4-alpha-glucan branching enzyme